MLLKGSGIGESLDDDLVGDVKYRAVRTALNEALGSELLVRVTVAILCCLSIIIIICWFVLWI